MICTKDRPQELRRGLISYAENLKRHERTAKFLVINDSSKPEQLDDIAEELEQHYSSTCFCVNRDQRRLLAEHIAAKVLLPPEIVKFGILGDPSLDSCSVGASRNTALLLCKDQRFVMVDDDSVCRLFTNQVEIDKQIRIRSWRPGEPPPYDHFFFDDAAQAIESFTELDLDFIGQHESVLGSNLSDIQSLPLGDVLSPGHGGIVSRSRYVNPRVVATACGFVGDSGSDWTGYFLLTNSGSVRRLTAEPEHVESYLRSRAIAVRVPQPLIWDGPLLGALNLGLDNRIDGNVRQIVESSDSQARSL